MIDKDGFQRPDVFDGHILELKNQKRRVVFDERYNFRPRNIFYRAWSAFITKVAIAILNPVLKIKYHMHIYGKQNAKALKKKAFICTCNHVHHFDDVSVGTNLFPNRKVYFTTLDANIRRPLIGFFLRSLGGIPIPVESLSGMKKFNSDVSEILKSGKPVLYNPESALWPYYREIRPYKKGAFSMAVKNDVPVLPLVVLFKRRKKRNGKFKYKLFLAVCRPIEIDQTLTDDRSKIDKLMKAVHETTKQVADEWYALQDCGFGDEGNLRKLKPKQLKLIDDKWMIKEKK